MSVQDERNAIIRENLTELIKQLTGFKEDDKNVRRCEQYATSIFENNRYLSTNSHQVRRQLDGIKEKFRVSNYVEYAEYLGKRCEQIIQHPLCTQHYELDVQWSLLDFLFTLAYNPIGAMRENKYEIDLTEPLPEDESTNSLQIELDYWKNELKEAAIKVDETSNDDSDTELSEWSDDGACDQPSYAAVQSPQTSGDKTSPKSVCLLPFLPTLKPPEKKSPFVVFNGDQAKCVLLQSVQHSWWLTDKTHRQVMPESPLGEANFAMSYAQYLSDSTNNLIPYKEPCMVSEYSLLREILWMFNRPTSCAFFDVGPNGLKVRDNVTLPSTSVSGLQSFLETNIVPYIQKMATLKSYISDAYKGDEFPPKTVECYAANLRSLLKPVWDELLDYEQDLITPSFNQCRTVIQFFGYFSTSGTFRHLEYLHDIHQKITLKLRACPAHVTSAHLLTGLMKYHCEASEINEANVAVSLFLTTVKIFCAIIDTWWLEGRLDDCQKEFLIERLAESDHNVRVRLFVSDKEKNIFLPAKVSQCIAEDRFFVMLQDHLLEAGHTLNLLYELNIISDLRVAALANRMMKDEEKFYDIFLREVMTFVNNQGQPKAESVVQPTQSNTEAELEPTGDVEIMPTENELGINSSPPTSSKCVPEMTCTNDEPDLKSRHSNDKRYDSGFREEDSVASGGCEEASERDALKNLTTKDDFLFLAFKNYLNVNEDDNTYETPVDTVDACKKPVLLSNMTALDIFSALKQCQYMLPMEEVILKTMSRLLKARTDFADAFVMQLYRGEYNIGMHLRNLRRVLLLEASDLMHQFYRKLFRRMQTDNWGNSVLLTSAFDDMTTAQYPEMSSKFIILIKPIGTPQTNKVFKGIDELSIDYNCSKGLSYIITPDSIGDYNRVFRFLLKIKWSLMAVEKLPFPRSHRQRPPYAPLEMIDFLARRLQQIRFWMLFALQNIHFHLMTHVLQSMGAQLDEKIAKCKTFKEMYAVHQSYLKTVCEHCFLEEGSSAVKLGIDMLMNLVFVMRYEWYSCINFIAENNPLAVDVDADDVMDPDNDYVLHNQIDAIESTYVRCHSYLASKFNHEVYVKKKTFLSGLSAAFNTSMPY